MRLALALMLADGVNLTKLSEDMHVGLSDGPALASVGGKE